MTPDNFNNSEIQKTLSSLDNIEKATPRPFFYTRLRERLNRQSAEITRVQWRWAITGTFFLILLNAAILSYSTASDQQAQNEQSLESIPDDYAIANFDIYNTTENVDENEY